MPPGSTFLCLFWLCLSPTVPALQAGPDGIRLRCVYDAAAALDAHAPVCPWWWRKPSPRYARCESDSAGCLWLHEVLATTLCSGVVLGSLVTTMWFAGICLMALTRTALGPREFSIWVDCAFMYLHGFEAGAVIFSASTYCSLFLASTIAHGAFREILPRVWSESLAKQARPTCLTAWL